MTNSERKRRPVVQIVLLCAGLLVLLGISASSIYLVTSLRRDADQMYQLCDELERQLASVYASKSWRVTRPLRWVYGVLAHRKAPPA